MDIVSYVIVGFILCAIIYLSMPANQNEEISWPERIVRSLLWFGSLLTLSVVAAFIYFINGVTISSSELELNAFGDYLAGASTFLAFLWLIITVVIQTLELRNQHIEMTRMSQSNDEQADSLKKALRFQALDYLEKKQTEKVEYLKERLEIVAEITVDFHERHQVIVGPTDFFNEPKDGVAYAASILCDTDLMASPLHTNGVVSINPEFSSDDHIFLVDLIAQASYVRKCVLPIQELASDMGANSTYEAWMQEMDLDWLLDWEPRINEIENVMRRLIADGQGHGFSDIQREVARLL